MGHVKARVLVLLTAKSGMRIVHNYRPTSTGSCFHSMTQPIVHASGRKRMHVRVNFLSPPPALLHPPESIHVQAIHSAGHHPITYHIIPSTPLPPSWQKSQQTEAQGGSRTIGPWGCLGGVYSPQPPPPLPPSTPQRPTKGSFRRPSSPLSCPEGAGGASHSTARGMAEKSSRLNRALMPAGGRRASGVSAALGSF